MKGKTSLKELVGIFFKYLFIFLAHLYLFVFYFGLPAGGCLAVVVLGKMGLEGLGVAGNVAEMIARILLTVLPIIPTIFYAKCADDDLKGEFSVDLCFAAWIMIIIWVWTILWK